MCILAPISSSTSINAQGMGTNSGVHGLWDFKAVGNIWKIIPLSGRRIVGEERHLEDKRVTFFCVSLDDGRVHWQGKSVAQAWWTGIEAVHQGVLFIHDYPVPSMPDHKKIIAIDASSGDPLWETPELTFGFASGASVFASKEFFDRKAFFELDLMTGAVVRELTADDLRVLRPDPGTGWGMDIGNADAVPGTRASVAGAFPAGTRLEPGGSMRLGDAEVCNWYEVIPDGNNGRSLREHLFVLDDRTGEILFRDVVCDGLALPAGATFFRAEERILYVKERTTLRSFLLSTAGAP